MFYNMNSKRFDLLKIENFIFTPREINKVLNFYNDFAL